MGDRARRRRSVILKLKRGQRIVVESTRKAAVKMRLDEGAKAWVEGNRN